MDRRVDPRVEVRLPCHVSLLQGKSRHLVGVTENMSRSGILVLWSATAEAGLPQVGEILTLEIDLPANHVFGRRCLYCRVTAVRICRQKSDGPLVGFQINQRQFRTYGSLKLAAPENQEECSRLLM